MGVIPPRGFIVFTGIKLIQKLRHDIFKVKDLFVRKLGKMMDERHENLFVISLLIPIANIHYVGKKSFSVHTDSFPLSYSRLSMTMFRVITKARSSTARMVARMPSR